MVEFLRILSSDKTTTTTTTTTIKAKRIDISPIKVHFSIKFLPLKSVNTFFPFFHFRLKELAITNKS